MFEPQPKLCSGPHCGAVFRPSGDNWIRLDRMHGDRVGDGTHNFCSRLCAIEWLTVQEDIGPETPIVARPGATWGTL
jgi:hypothetical protein